MSYPILPFLNYITYNNLEEFERELLEHIQIEISDNYLVFEAYSIFKECEDLVELISNSLKEEIKLNKKIEFEYNVDANSFASKIHLVVNRNNQGQISAIYNSSKSEFSENKFNSITIHINIPSNDFSRYWHILDKQLAHELTHAYNDYKRCCSNEKFSLKYLNNSKYNNAIRNISSKNQLKQLVSKFEYFTNTEEQNAYLAEIAYELKSRKQEINKLDIINSIYKILSSLTWYKNYCKLNEFIQLINSSEFKNKTFESNLEYAYCSVFKQSNKTNVISYLTTEWYKFKKIVENKLSKIIYQTISEI